MPPLQRKASFTSMAMAQGTFLPRVNCPVCIINGAAYFEGDAPSEKDLINSIVYSLLGYERFSKVLDLKTGYYRPSQTDYEASDLVRSFVVEGETDVTHEEIHSHMQDELVDGRNDLPWWEVLVIQNNGPGLSAAVLRLHHSIGDGLGLVEAFAKIWKQEDGSPVEAMGTRFGSVPRPRMNIFRKMWALLVATTRVATLGMSKFDDDTVFSKCNHGKMVRSAHSKVVMLPPIPLEFIKRLKTAANVTVNDILLAAVSQSVHRYCKHDGNTDAVLQKKGAKCQCRALLPVGLPRTQKELEKGKLMRNKWCLVSCDVALGEEDILKRLQRVRENTNELKTKPYALVQLWLQNKILRMAPRSVAQQVAFDAFSRHSMVLTNVPGPSHACYVAGKRVESVQLYVSNLLTQVDFMSYNGLVQGNIVYDPESLENMDSFADHYVEALAKMASRLEIDLPAEVEIAV